MDIELLPEWFVEKLKKVDEKFVGLTEIELEDMLRPDAFVRRVRLAFWKEYEKAASKRRWIEVSNIASMMNTPKVIIESTMKNLRWVPYLACAPSSYESFLDEALAYGLNRLRNEVLTAPIYKENGSFDARAADLILKTVAYFDVRKNGMPTQNIQNLNIHTSAKDMKDIQKMASDMSLTEIQDKIRELEDRGITHDLAKKVLGTGNMPPSGVTLLAEVTKRHTEEELLPVDAATAATTKPTPDSGDK